MTAVAEAQAPPEPERAPLVAELERVRVLLEALRAGEPPPSDDDEFVLKQHEVSATPALDRLAALVGLTPFERSLLVLAAGVELDAELAALVAELQGGLEPRPTFGLALAALPEPHWDALAPGSPLRRHRLVEPGEGPTLATRPLRLDERILHFLTGVDALDPRLEGVVRPWAAPAPLAPGQQELAAEAARTALAAGPRVLQRLDGDDADALLGVAAAVAAHLGLAPLFVRGGALPPPGPELAALARLVDREALLADALPVVEADGAADTTLAALLEELDVPLALLVGETAVRATDRVGLHRAVPLPPPAEARALWTAAVDGDEMLAPVVEELAQHFRLSAAAIAAIGREVAAAAPGADAPTLLRRLCRERARVPLEGLAERIEPRAGWDDLVLPPAHLELLRELAVHVRHRTQVYERWGFGAHASRGLGVTALFAGESGTGKTLAAEVLAGELGLDLYRIDLAATVSKYIGETEKNLRRLFEAAEASGAVLLFDEADALFGRRSEVRDAHDRYANLEVAYLLQRMESYRGLAILTTNLRAHVDRAFLRRLRFVVEFPFPDAALRAEIWRRTLPAAAPLDGVTPETLAGLNVAGGSIRSIALGAAFAAAEAGTALTAEHVLRAARVDYAKAERTLTDAETEALR